MSVKFKDWMEKATTLEKEILAAESSTTLSYLYSIASGQRTASADVAGRIEKAAKNLYKQSKRRLPKIIRSDIAPACAACPYAPKCEN